ncbi:uncharacterized protein LOC129905084 [Episyrphus balteatus]|uniref:uncharacterized protein LOC129905084 n=1 Tax=Episyrphus balteatus TaxID=286459 RepID=UPI002485996A|nr:uncharacterized protein LOC129905084 [Episyrphus balteatus]
MISLNNILEALRVLPTSPKDPVDIAELPEINLQEVANHDHIHDCWIVLYDRVYDVTKFLYSHPGGEDVILDHAGRDATLAFHGTGHSKAATHMLRDYLVGELPISQRIFRNQITGSGVLLSGIPD